MSLDGFLTFLTVIIGIYAIMPTVARLRISLKKFRLLTISIIALILVVYFEFFKVFSVACPSSLGSLCQWLVLGEQTAITNQQAAFIVVGIWIVIASTIIRRTKIAAWSLPILSRIVSLLIYERKFSEAVDFVEPHLPLIERVAKGETVACRLRTFILKLDPGGLSHQEMLDLLTTGNLPQVGPSLRDRLNRSIWRHISKIGYLLPSGERAEQAASDIFRVLLRDSDFVKYSSLYRPGFGVRLLHCRVFGVDDFFDSYLKHLISNVDSALYREIEQNQNFSTCGYHFPRRNAILYFLFHDAKNAERLSAWRPIGEFLIGKLGKSTNADYIAFLNRTSDEFSEHEKWRDPVFVGLQYFDLMVTAAACQGIRWHMWLYYMPYFVERLVANYDTTGEEVDSSKEWPTRASYLLYYIFSLQCDWIRMINTLPDESSHRQISNDRPCNQNDNIPKSSALSLGRCISMLLESDNVGWSFKKYCHNIVLSLIRSMPIDGELAVMRRLLINSVLNRGILGPNANYGEKLVALWQGEDHVLRFELQDYESAMLQAYA